MFDVPEFEPAFKELYTGTGTVTCLTSKKVFTNLPRPTVVVLDVSIEL